MVKEMMQVNTSPISALILEIGESVSVAPGLSQINARHGAGFFICQQPE